MTERNHFIITERQMFIKQSINQSITTEITQNKTSKYDMDKEHAINKIPIIMSMCKFEIMISGAQIETIIGLPG